MWIDFGLAAAALGIGNTGRTILEFYLSSQLQCRPFSHNLILQSSQLDCLDRSQFDLIMFHRVTYSDSVLA